MFFAVSLWSYVQLYNVCIVSYVQHFVSDQNVLSICVYKTSWMSYWTRSRVSRHIFNISFNIDMIISFWKYIFTVATKANAVLIPLWGLSSPSWPPSSFLVVLTLQTWEEHSRATASWWWLIIRHLHMLPVSWWWPRSSGGHSSGQSYWSSDLRWLIAEHRLSSSTPAATRPTSCFLFLASIFPSLAVICVWSVHDTSVVQEGRRYLLFPFQDLLEMLFTWFEG